MEPDEIVHGRATDQGVPAPPEPSPPAGEAPSPPAAEVSRRRLTIFRVLAAIPVVVFFVAELNLLAPWVFVLNNEDNPEPHKWFYVVSGSADIFMLVTFLGLIVRPRLVALAAWIVISLAIVLVAIVSLQPAFLIFVLVVAGPAAIAYPYWRDLRSWRTWWRGARPQLVALAAAACLVLVPIAVVAFRRQIVNDDSAADANWWNDSAEHITDIALVGLLAASTAPGALVLRATLSASYLYLGIIAAFVLPDATASWGLLGGLLAIAAGIGFAVGTWVDLPKRPTASLPGQRRGSHRANSSTTSRDG
jgi:hypothetical protein